MSDDVSMDSGVVGAAALDSDEKRNPAALTVAAENKILRLDNRFLKCASDTLAGVFLGSDSASP